MSKETKGNHSTSTYVEYHHFTGEHKMKITKTQLKKIIKEEIRDITPEAVKLTAEEANLIATMLEDEHNVPFAWGGELDIDPSVYETLYNKVKE